MPGYHNDQFFRVAGSGENLMWEPSSLNNPAGRALTGADNPPFIYPDRTVRTDGPDGWPNDIALQRGYIRSLKTYVGQGVDLEVHKCQFQFNPQSLHQVVDAASNTLDFLHLDPGQYAVPRSASVNFTFDLLFDRSMEMNNGSSNLPDPSHPWESGDPSQVGVLRDLSAFYGVIGQAIRKDQIGYMQKQLTDQITRDAARSTTDSETDTTTQDAKDSINALPDFLKANAANSAFLLPVPVRVMFSTLYMVEGFVTNTTVAFTKFSTSMVPMQCALAVTMEAKYIGFAQATSFLTWALENAKQGQLQDEKATADQVRAMYIAMAKSANKIETWITNQNDNSAASLNMIADPGYKFKIHGKFPNAKDTDDDPVVKLFASSTPPNITTQINFVMYGPYDSSAANLSTSALRNYVLTHGTQAGYSNNTFVAAGMVNGQNSAHGHAGTFEEWKDMISGYRNDDWQLNSSDFDGDIGDYDVDNKWWIVNYKANVQATTGDFTVEGNGETWELHDTAFFNFTKTLTLSWPDYTPTEGTGVYGTVPQSNVTTDPPPLGSVSNVGGTSR